MLIHQFNEPMDLSISLRRTTVIGGSYPNTQVDQVTSRTKVTNNCEKTDKITFNETRYIVSATDKGKQYTQNKNKDSEKSKDVRR